MLFLDELYHYGTPHVGTTPHSGRYPYGSGENAFQRNGIRSIVKDLRSQGMNDTDIARYLGMSTKEFRERITVEKEAQIAADTSKVIRMKDHGYSVKEISEKTGIPQTTVRNYLNPITKERSNKTRNVADVLKDRVDKNKYIDVGTGSSVYLGISDQRLNAAVKMLQDEGYILLKPKVEQAGNPGKFTTLKVLAPPGIKPPEAYSEINKDWTKVKMIEDYHFNDNGLTGRGLVPPKSIDSNRIKIRYAEDGGNQKDGVIELRRGVEDISLGNSQYAQVRIAVDGTHYLKGMAVYSDDLPKGIDILFNTNKHEGTPMIGEKDNSVLKPLKKDKDGNIDMQNPFGATIKDMAAGGQRYYIDKNGKEQLSVINKVKDEGDWETWKKTLSAQFLSKQSYPLIKKQLDLTYKNKVAEYDEIKSLTNPTIKRQLLESFAEDCDSSAVKLKAAALPRQTFKVILPVTQLKDNEIYAPGYRDGEQVALVRYPHGGTFEIPILTVNNKNKAAKSIFQNARDAVGINSNVAERLSGADFDGDTVMVIPTSNTKVKSTPPLDGLKNFDPKERYPGYEGMKKLEGENKQKEMGKVTNLIADMTLKGATEDEIARAVRHSMVVIDAEKHNLNYKLSEKENGIDALKKKYQQHNYNDKYGGASTLITKSNSEQRIDEVKQWRLTPYSINEKGEKILVPTNRTYINKDGKEVKFQTVSTKMAETNDAFSLVSDVNNRKEIEYAKYANNLKALANDARKEAISTPKLQRNPSATKAYSQEVASLNAKLNMALKNAPRERQAQLVARQNINTQLYLNPQWKGDKDAEKKLRTQSLGAARAKVGAGKPYIEINDREWEAIQAGAISDSKLRSILINTKDDSLKQRAMPRNKQGMNSSKIARARAMADRGYELAEIADMLGVSVSTISNALNN